METTVDGTFFQEEDHIRVRSTGETGRVNAIAGGVVYVLMDTTNESKVFAASFDEDAAIELVGTEHTTNVHGDTPFSAQLSEQWLLERTYHAQLLNGKELSMVDLTKTMEDLSDASVPLSAESSKSRLPENLPLKKSHTFIVPISTWQETTQEEARASYQQGKPVLLYSEHAEKYSQEIPEIWHPNRNMRTIIYGDMLPRAEATSETEYAVCYLDARQGTFSNASWKAWFSSDTAVLFDHYDRPVTFLRPCVQFPFTTHYTVIAADGHVSEYPDPAEALQGFTADPLREEHHGNAIQVDAPYFCYYHEVTCPSGTYRLEFFGPHMNEQGYRLTV